jgi:tetratricopeptide (TPR) repeat protein
MLAKELLASLRSSVLAVQSTLREGDLIFVGSGIVVEPGRVVTSKHVVEGRVAITVKRGDKAWPAEVAYLDPSHDICLLRVENLEARPVQMRRNASLTSDGERVYAISAPNGDLTLSKGRISGLRWQTQNPDGTTRLKWISGEDDVQWVSQVPTFRLRWQDGTKLIEHTAPTSRGWSGGGLFDSEGRLIGITTWVYTEEGESLNFAVTADLVSTLPLEDSESRFSVLKERASQEFSGANYAAAVELCWKALELRPVNAQVWWQLAVSYERAHFFAASAWAYREALRLKPDFANAWRGLGDACIRGRRFDGAVEAYKELSKIEPTDANVWMGLGDVYRDKGSHGEALAAYGEAIRLNPGDDTAYTAVGWLHLDTNDYSQAIAAFLEATRLEPGKARNWYYLAAGYLHQGDIEKRLQALRRLKELDPKAAGKFPRSVVVAPPDRLRMEFRPRPTQTFDEVWKRDRKVIRELNENSITARAWGCRRDEPEMVASALKPHIEQLLEAGNQMAPQNTGQLLELGHWIDAISIALVKLKKWEEARYWLELFFSLDPRYQDWLAESEKEKLLKRRLRCKAQLAK